MTQQEINALVGKTIVIRNTPHLCLCSGDDAILLLQICAKDEPLFKSGDPVQYIVGHYPEWSSGQLVWCHGSYYPIYSYCEQSKLPASAQALQDALGHLTGADK